MLMMSNSAFAAFEKTVGLPSILVAEVKSYGEVELIPKYFEDFKDSLSTELIKTEKFRVDTSRIGTNIEQPTEEDELFSTIHMDAIARGHLYKRELANVQMIIYGDSIFGKQYYQNEEKIAQRLKLEGQPYKLGDEITKKVIQLGQQYDVDYMLFVNLRDVDVWRKTGGIFGTHTSAQEYRGKKAIVELEFYLINTKTGKVFEGQNKEKKTSLVTNILIDKYGNNFTIQQMIQELITNQTKQIVKSIEDKGIKCISE